MILHGKESPVMPDRELVYNTALHEALALLRNSWYEENIGIVAAALLENENIVTATSRYLPGKNKWLHAEAATLQKFEETFGRKPEPESVIAVTLSPCFGRTNTRLGLSCAHRLMASGIRRVRFGCLDTAETPDIRTFEVFGFEARLVGDTNLRKTSESLFKLFGELHPNGRFASLLSKYPNPWPEIKRQIGLAPFEDF